MIEDYFGEEHKIFRNSVRKFVEKEIMPHLEKWEDEETFPVELYAKCGQAGFLCLQFPEEYGGTPCDKFMFIAFIEEFLRCGSLGLFSGICSHTIAIPPVLNLGTEEQKQEFLVPVLKGEKIAALGITEPDAGSDVANIRTRAVRDGDYYIVNGTKTFIASGCRANFVTTAVRKGGPGNKGISLLIIGSTSPGFKVAKKIRKMGWHSSDTADLSFEDCRVPVKNLIGKEGGTVTAGNSSSMNDASAGYLVMTEKKAAELGCTPVARVVSYALAGVDPDIMGIGPVPATQKALKRGGLKMEDIDLFEYN